MQELGPTYAAIFSIVSLVIGVTMDDPCGTMMNVSLAVQSAALLFLGACILYRSRITDIIYHMMFVILTVNTLVMAWTTIDVFLCKTVMVKGFVIYVLMWIHMVVWIIMVLTYAIYHLCGLLKMEPRAYSFP
jgi:hypothetical protein